MGRIWTKFVWRSLSCAIAASAVLLLATACGLTIANPGLFAGDSAVSVSITGPGSVTLGGQSQYAATVTGSSNTAVSWSVNGVAGGNAAVGQITASGLYKAPSAMPSSSSTVSITATSAAAASASKSLSVTLAAPPVTGGNPAPPTVSIALTGPASATLGKQYQYTATVSGSSNGAVVWTVNGAAGGSAAAGTITAAGLYTAPATMPTAGHVTVTATSVADTSVSQSIVVTLAAPPATGGNPPPPTVSIALSGPTSATLGKQYQYTATVSGSSDTAVTWTVNGAAGGSAAAGTITPAGLYSAPAVMPASGHVTVTATSVADSSVSQSIVVALNAPPAGTPPPPTVTVVVSGANSVELGAPSQYAATVSGSSNQAVTWTVNGVAGGSIAAGLISADGLYTAPATMPASPTIEIAATSVANPTVSQSLAVTLQAASAPPVNTPPPPPTSPATSVTISGPTTVNVGTPVQYAATVAGTANQMVSWSIAPAAGSISAAGLYTPPSTVPAANQVTVKAVSAQTPSVAGTLTITLLDPVPVITSATATVQGATQNYLIDVLGDGFVRGAQLVIGGQAVTTTQVSAEELEATIASGGAQQVTVIVENPNPGETQSAPATVLLKAPQTTATAAARLLDQATFGPTALTIQHVESVGLQGYLNEQFADSPTYLPALPAQPPSQCSPESITSVCVRSNWFQNALTANDQLRQRVAFALSQIWVASSYNGYMITPYANLLVKDAFSNYRQIMYDMTLSPNMGSFLNMLNSPAAPAGQIANENYGRELMQLFTMGPNLLNEDGTFQTDSHGDTIPAYSELQVQAMAKALTGWTYVNADGSTPANFIFTPNWNHLMVPVDMRHDATAKTLLDGVTLPAGQSAAQDLNDALDDVFNHPNVGPFVSRQLIQHLVAGNPSPAYVKRVAEVFADNGQGVRGDMKAVITAILLDPEARANDTQTGDELEANPAVDSGHLREPALWAVEVARGLNAVSSNTDPSNAYPFINMGNGQLVAIGEPPFGALTVFNFFPPSYTIPQTSINAPEFGLENTGSIIPRLNLANYIMHNSASGLAIDFSTSGPFGSKTDPGALVDYLGMIFMHGQMPTDMRTTLVDYISPVSDPAERASLAAYLVVTSTQYKIMH